MIRVPRIAGTAVFLAAWLMPWRPVFRVRADGIRMHCALPLPADSTI
jgi:hypothetical protein